MLAFWLFPIKEPVKSQIISPQNESEELCLWTYWLFPFFIGSLTSNPSTCAAPCSHTHRSLSVSVRVFCCRRWTMKTVTATPAMRPMATTPPRIPITPPGGPCGSGFSADKWRNNSVRHQMLSGELMLFEWTRKRKMGTKNFSGYKPQMMPSSTPGWN